MDKKLNNLLGFDDFHKSWNPEEQKKTKRTEVGLDIVKEKNDVAIEVSDLKKGIDKKLNNLIDFDDFDKTFNAEKQKKTKRTEVGLDIIKEDNNLPMISPEMKRAKDRQDSEYGSPPETARMKNTMYFPSSKYGHLYTVGFDTTRNEWTCTCPGWLIARNGDKNRKCKHLLSIASAIGGEQGKRLKSLGGR